MTATRLSAPHTAAGKLQRACLALLRQTEAGGIVLASPTSTRFVYYALKQAGYPVARHARRRDDQDVIDAVERLRSVRSGAVKLDSDETRRTEVPSGRLGHPREGPADAEPQRRPDRGPAVGGFPGQVQGRGPDQHRRHESGDHQLDRRVAARGPGLAAVAADRERTASADAARVARNGSGPVIAMATRGRYLGCSGAQPTCV
jgi:hypothetical protein